MLFSIYPLACGLKFPTNNFKSLESKSYAWYGRFASFSLSRSNNKVYEILAVKVVPGKKKADPSNLMQGGAIINNEPNPNNSVYIFEIEGCSFGSHV
jgi:hypothetical protein